MFVYHVPGWPLWLLTLGPELLDDEDISVPFLNIFFSLLLLIIPLGIGMVLKRCLPKAARFMIKILRPMAIFLILFITTFGTYVNIYVLDFVLTDWRVTVCSALLPWSGTLVSGFTAYMLGQSWYRAKTVGIETALQNTALTLVMLRATLPQPEADIAAVMPYWGTLLAPVPLFINALYRLYKHFCTADTEVDMTKETLDFQSEDAHEHADTASVYTISMNGYINPKVSDSNIPDGLSPSYDV